MRLSRMNHPAVALLCVLLCSCLAHSLSAQDKPDEIPELKSDVVIALILFEVDGLAESDINVLDIRQFEEMAKVQVSIRDNNGILNFVCRKTDFGLKWRLAEKIPEELLQTKTTPKPAETKTEPDEISESNLEPASATGDVKAEKKFPNHEDFIDEFLAALRDGSDQDYERFFFRDTDFEYANVDDETGNPLETLKARREAFIQQCSNLAARLKEVNDFKVVSYFSRRSTRGERAQLKLVLPTAMRYRKTVSVEVIMDGKLGTLIFEGVTLLADGWRLGAVTESEETP